MIIDYTQKKDLIQCSYVNDNNQISIEEIFLKENYYKYVECDVNDPNRIPNLLSFYNSPIKKESAHFFTNHNINEFFNTDIPLNYKEYADKFFNLNEPNPFSVDIEVLPTDEYGYSPASEANNPVTSIQITDKSLSTIIFVTKNSKFNSFNDFDISYINALLKEQLGKYSNDYNYNWNIRFFDTEQEMLNTFLECVNKHFHLIFGWNFLLYDWQYIFNRSIKIGIDPKKASPTQRLSKKSVEINDKTKVELELPTHRIILDYELLFKESLIYNNLGSYSLNSIADLVLGLNKVSYTGNLRTLYNDDFRKFIAYAIVDPILVQLIHKSTNLLTVDFFQSYYCGVPFCRLSQNSISEALVFQELKESNQFLLESEKTNAQGRKYQGGYVKAPLKKIIEAVLGEDYGSLYPNSMITAGLSPEAKVDSLQVDESGFPCNSQDIVKWEKYKSLGYCLSPAGRVYKMDKDYLYTRIEKKLLKQRKIFRGHQDDIYLNIIPKLEEAIKLKQNKN
jgi:DNA polymerase elongation subunit (family B)